MDDFNAARALHVLAVLMWIGGVAFVTTVAMPSIRRNSAPDKRTQAFHRFEGRFARQARLWVLLAGASGFWMIYRGDMWDRFAHAQFWWMHSMVLIWLSFSAMLFVIEPLFLHRRLVSTPGPSSDFARMEWMHRVLLVLSLVTLVGAVGGSHGLL